MDKKFVFADDDPGSLRLYHTVLEQIGYSPESGYDIRYARDGREALERCRSIRMESSPPDLLVTDYGMPEMDGLGLLRALDGEGISIPHRVLLTGEDEGNEHVKEALGMGAVYIPKLKFFTMFPAYLVEAFPGEV